MMSRFLFMATMKSDQNQGGDDGDSDYSPKEGNYQKSNLCLVQTNKLDEISIVRSPALEQAIQESKQSPMTENILVLSDSKPK